MTAQRYNVSPLTNAELRECPVPVTGSLSISGGLTNTELRAAPVPVSQSGSWSISGTVAVSGPLTDAQLRATAVPVSGTVSVSGAVAVTGTFWQATQPVSGTVGISGTVPVSGTFWQATQPVSGTVTANAGSGTFAISAASLPLPSGAATAAKQPALGTAGTASADVLTVQGVASMTALKVDGSGVTQPVSGTFWQSTQPVSIASMPSTPVTGTFWQSTQPVSLASLPALATGSNVIGALTANQSVNNAQVAGVATATGNGVVGTGVQRVAIASDNTAFSVNATLQAGTAAFGKLAANSGVTIGAVEIAATQTLATVTTVSTVTNLSQLGGQAVAMGTGVRSAGTQRVTVATDDLVPVSPPTLTKGSQGATGLSTQDLKDAGRTLFSAATVIGGVTAVSTEALLSLVATRAGVAAGGATTQAVTAGKALRVTGIIASVRSSAATVLSGRVALRMNPSGAVTATSPIIAILSMTQQAAALAEAGDTCVLPLPDGLEFSGTQQIGLTQVCSGTGGVVYASILGFEY
jgi:hypothetical protein